MSTFLRVFLASALLAAFSFPVRAADLSKRIQDAAPLWAGVYIGANVGYGSASLSSPELGWGTADGFVAGGQIGYNWQIGSLVIGAEGDLQATGQKSVMAEGLFSLTSSIPYFATVRGRLGLAAGPVLLYGTGGWSYTSAEVTLSLLGLNAITSSRKSSWVAGAGAEWMFAPKWSAKAEYLYIDTGNNDLMLLGMPFTGRSQSHILRTGVNFHF